MLSEYGSLVDELKAKDKHFAAILQKHEELNNKIDEVEAGREHLEQLDLEKLKKEKLILKDEAYALISAYKKEKQ